MRDTTTGSSSSTVPSIQSGWNSTSAVVLGIAGFRVPTWWPLWILLWILAFWKLEKRYFLAFSLLIGLRLWMVAESTAPLHHSLPTKFAGCIQETVRTPKGFRMQVLLPTHHSILLRSQEPQLPGTCGSIHATWDPVIPRTVPGTFDPKRWLHSQGSVASGKMIAWQPKQARFHINRFAFAAREWLRTLCLKHMEFKTAGVMVALLVGDKSGLDEEISKDFRSTGLVHILTVSGFHIVFLSAFIQMMLAAFRLPRKIVGWIAILLLLVFIPITGSSPAVQRAVLMFFLVQAARGLERPSLSLHALGVASTLILLWEPDALWDIGFQLSCGATAGILFGQNGKPQCFERAPWLLKNALLEPTWITLCATAGTFPFLVYHFQSFSPIAFAGNLVVAPLMGLAMEAGVLLVLSAGITPIAHGFGQSASLLLDFAVRGTQFFAEIPGGICSVGPWPLWLSLTILAACLALLQLRGAPRIVRCMIVAGCAAWALWPFSQSPSFRLHIVDAGQGDCILLQFPNTKTILVDVGNGKDQGRYGSRTVAPFLRHLGISHIDALVITHPDLDHYGGARSFIENFPVQAIWIPRAARLCDKPEWQEFLGFVTHAAIPMHTIRPGMEFTGLGPYSLRWLWAAQEVENDDWNAISAAFILYADNKSLFFSGGDLGLDQEQQILEQKALWRNVPPSLDIFKLGHHGSKHSSGRAFLNAIQPGLGIICAGQGNRYGHPHQEVLQRLQQQGIPWENTARCGSIHIEWNGMQASYQCFRDSISSVPIPVPHR